MSRLMRKVNADESCDNYDSIATFRESLPWDEKRVTYISSRWNVSRNVARTLILKEVGTCSRDIANMLYVTKSTVSKYVNELCDKIHVNAVAHISYKRWNGLKYDVWGQGEADPIPVTDPPQCEDSPKPINKGVPMAEIPKELITVEYKSKAQ